MKQNTKDGRINARYPVWLEYLAVWFVMCCITGGQAMIYYRYVDFSYSEISLSFIFANIGYWGLMSLIFCIVTMALRRRTWEKPMKRLSEAARRVAGGDFSVHIDPLRQDGRKDYVEVMFDDFNKMVEELGSIETLTNDFVANVSHEIKTPLSVIQSYASALKKPGISEELRGEYADTIVSASARLNTLVLNVLKLSKLENQAISPCFKEYDLCGQLAECALRFEEQWEAKGIAFTAETDDRAMIRADQELLEIVWSNLLSNALKFTEPGGSVALTQTSDENTVTVTVTDTGCGISESTRNRIFDKFYQGDTSHSKEGNGLGLALTKRVIEIMGGQLSAKSEPGKGSAFTVTLNTGL